MKEPLKQLPPIDAVRDHDTSPEYAAELLDDLGRHYTRPQISAHIGVCKRSLIYMRSRGIKSYPDQLALEVLAGRKKIR